MDSRRNLFLLLGCLWVASVAGAFYAGGGFRSGKAVGGSAAGTDGTERIPSLPGGSPGTGSGSRLAPSPLAASPTAAGSASAHGADATGKLSFNERFKALMESDDAVGKMSGFLDLLDELGTSEDFASVVEALNEDFNPRENGKEFSMLMQKWAEIDPRGALEYAGEMEDWQGRWASATVLSKFVATNREEAIAWAMEKGAPTKGREEDGNWMIAGVIAGLAKIDPKAATELARNEPRSRARGEMLDDLLDAYLGQDQDKAREWATNLPDDAFKVGALSRLTARLADDDLPSTVKWVESLPTGEATPRVYAELVERWAREDPNEAGTWLGKFPASPEMDEPRQTFAWRIRERDPESAIAWAATISNPEQRDRATYELARDWVRREPEVAKTWVTSSPLPDDVKRRLLGG